MIGLSINNIPIINGSLTLPETGAWFGEFTLNTEEAPSGNVIIHNTDNTIKFIGYVTMSGVTRGTTLVRVVGGKGQLSFTLKAKSYFNTSAKVLVLDSLTESKEILSSSLMPELNAILPFWVRKECSVGELLNSVSSEIGCSWRVLSDGTVWIGKDLWKPIVIPFNITKDSPQAGRTEYWIDSPILTPGVLFDNKKITKVQHIINTKLRTIVWYQGTYFSDDINDNWERLVKHFTSHIDYFAMYEAKVVTQNSDGTLELIPFDVRIPSLSHVPIRYGIPGVKATVLPGSRVAVEFASGNPSQPRATVWDLSTVSKLEVTATQIVLNGGVLPVARQSDLAGPYPISTGNVTVLA